MWSQTSTSASAHHLNFGGTFAAHSSRDGLLQAQCNEQRQHRKETAEGKCGFVGSDSKSQNYVSLIKILYAIFTKATRYIVIWSICSIESVSTYPQSLVVLFGYTNSGCQLLRRASVRSSILIIKHKVEHSSKWLSSNSKPVCPPDHSCQDVMLADIVVLKIK